MKPGRLFHLVNEQDRYYLQGNQADHPCLFLGYVPLEFAERIHDAIEKAWRRDEEWRAGVKPERMTNNESQGTGRNRLDGG